MTRIVIVAVVVLFTVGCGGSKAGGGASGAKGSKGGSLGRIDANSRCDAEGKREVMVDLNQDKVADVRKVYAPSSDGEVIACREADLNFDGSKDIFVFFDESGMPKRDEVDLDFDGVIDIVTTYVAGKVVKQELDTNSDGQIDRVRFLKDGCHC